MPVFVTTHVAAGALIGRLLPDSAPAAAVTGFLSHFALDALPHWGVSDRRVFLRAAVVDGLAGLALVGLASRHRRTSPAVLAAMLGAALPDADKPSTLFFGGSPFPARFDRFHGRIQRESPDALAREVLVALVGIAVVLRGRG